MMESYGPVCILWEGGYNGEKYSQELKYRLKGGLRDWWHINLLQHVLVDDAMKRIELPIKDHTSEKVHRDNNFKRYNTAFNAKFDYEHRRLISVVMYEGGRWGAITKDRCFFVEVTVEGNTQIINGQHYWFIKIADHESLNDADIEHCCILLPNLTSNGLPKSIEQPIYCIINSKWKDAIPNRNGQPCLVHPTLT